MDTNWVHFFSDPCPSERAEAQALLGGKGMGLCHMHALGLPVPPGFVLTTLVCRAYYQKKKKYPDHLKKQVREAIQSIEGVLDKGFGDKTSPLLLSIRSGGRASMPGMMDTILNLGLNDQTVEALSRKTKDARFAYDSYRRFIQMYSNVVLGLSLTPFEEILEQYRAVRHVDTDGDLSAEDLLDIVESFKKKILLLTGKPFPQNVKEQLWGGIRAVLNSWQNPRAAAYRDLYSIPEDWGTAVVIQAMVFGNQDDQSGTGVAFTRDPSTGEKVFFGEYLLKAQGEDVVGGIRTPHALTKAQKKSDDEVSLEEKMPAVFDELCRVKDLLEGYYRDMQDIEFTIQQGKLWLLQTRNGKRTARASLKITVDMVNEKLITQEAGLRRVDSPTLGQLFHPQLSAHDKTKLSFMGKGLPASPGAAVGRVVLTADECVSRAVQGEKVILVREETSPEDIHGMAVAQGILTARGGMTSHAAVVARGMGLPCVSGTEDLSIDLENQRISLGHLQVKAGEDLTLDGVTGEVFKGLGKLSAPQEATPEFKQLMDWADGLRRLRIRANADTPHDAEKALNFGAEGIGLCRTEHMFFEARRIMQVRKMILAQDDRARHKALKKVLAMQRQDFVDIFRIMAGKPVTVRLLDPPLHEFLPRSDMEIEQLAGSLRKTVSAVRHRINELEETNPMLGHRGCRLGMTSPEIYDSQIQALFEAAEVVAQEGIITTLEIMIPLVALTGELKNLRKRIDAKAKERKEISGIDIPYLVGTMIELPRAALKADKLAHYTDFISFGTNDLTQTTFGFSRDDAGVFLQKYRQMGVIERDPFVSLDKSGVGELTSIACERARQTKPDIKLGICGEHGGDPLSIAFFEKLRINYVSCSPYRLPAAKLAAAQAVIQEKSETGVRPVRKAS